MSSVPHLRCWAWFGNPLVFFISNTFLIFLLKKFLNLKCGNMSVEMINSIKFFIIIIKLTIS